MAKKTPSTPQNKVAPEASSAAPVPTGAGGRKASPAPRSSGRKAEARAVADDGVTGGMAATLPPSPAPAARGPVSVEIPAQPGLSADQAPAGASDGKPAREITHQMIAERAYELFNRGVPGSPDDHWLQAERELRGQ